MLSKPISARRATWFSSTSSEEEFVARGDRLAEQHQLLVVGRELLRAAVAAAACDWAWETEARSCFTCWARSFASSRFGLRARIQKAATARRRRGSRRSCGPAAISASAAGAVVGVASAVAGSPAAGATSGPSAAVPTAPAALGRRRVEGDHELELGDELARVAVVAGALVAAELGCAGGAAALDVLALGGLEAHPGHAVDVAQPRDEAGDRVLARSRSRRSPAPGRGSESRSATLAAPSSGLPGRRSRSGWSARRRRGGPARVRASPAPSRSGCRRGW